MIIDVHLLLSLLSVSVCFTYGKCSKILNAFLLLFSNKMLLFNAGIHKMFFRKTNREDPDQTASEEAV